MNSNFVNYGYEFPYELYTSLRRLRCPDSDIEEGYDLNPVEIAVDESWERNR